MQIAVSVLLPVFNAEDFLESSIWSILNQTVEDFELIIIDDGSTDRSAVIMDEMAAKDNRITILRNDQNIGVQRCLNQGIDVSTGDYIARMDADDISLPNRLEKQLTTFYRDECLVMVGTNCTLVSENLSFIGSTLLPLDDWSIRCLYLVMNPFVHSSVMFKGGIIRDRNLRYDTFMQAAIDYELWSRILAYGTVCNLPDQLVFLRKHNKSFSEQYSAEQIDCFLQVRQTYRQYFIGGRDASDPKVTEYSTAVLGSQTNQVSPLNSIQGCKSSIKMMRTLKRRFPDKNMLSVEVYIKCRSVLVGIRSFKCKDAWGLLRNAIIPSNVRFICVTGHFLWRALQFTSRIRLIKYRRQHRAKIKQDYVSEH